MILTLARLNLDSVHRTTVWQQYKKRFTRTLTIEHKITTCSRDNYNFLTTSTSNRFGMFYTWKPLLHDNTTIWCHVKRFKFCVINLADRKTLASLPSPKCYAMNTTNRFFSCATQNTFKPVWTVVALGFLFL